MNCKEFIVRHGQEAFANIFMPRKNLQEEYPVYFACNMLFILDGEFIGQFLNTQGFSGLRGYEDARSEYLRHHSLAEWEYQTRTTPIHIQCGSRSETTYLVLPSTSTIIIEARILRDDHARF